MRCSDYLVHCFGYSELLLQVKFHNFKNNRTWTDAKPALTKIVLQLILRREKEQDASKGPVQFIVFFDLATVNLTDYVNPLSAQMKLWQVRSDLWQDWWAFLASLKKRLFVLSFANSVTPFPLTLFFFKSWTHSSVTGMVVLAISSRLHLVSQEILHLQRISWETKWSRL